MFIVDRFWHLSSFCGSTLPSWTVRNGHKHYPGTVLFTGIRKGANGLLVKHIGVPSDTKVLRMNVDLDRIMNRHVEPSSVHSNYTQLIRVPNSGGIYKLPHKFGHQPTLQKLAQPLLLTLGDSMGESVNISSSIKNMSSSWVAYLFLEFR